MEILPWLFFRFTEDFWHSASWFTTSQNVSLWYKETWTCSLLVSEVFVESDAVCLS